MSVEEWQFTLQSGLTVAARVHRPGAGRSVLAVHGWLDNAASFDALAARLPACEIVALDLIGHGHSDHRPPGTWYHYVDYLDELIEVLDRLGWSRSVWLGHSLGGALLAMLAAARPDRVDRLVMIESAGLMGGDPQHASEQLRRGLDDRASFRAGKSLRVFADPAQAIAARAAAGRMPENVARVLVERGMRPVDGGHVWASDPRLRLASPLRIDERHLHAMLAAIACPTLLLLAQPPLPFMAEAERRARLACFARAEVHQFPGHHHLHMETAEPLAERIREFLAS